jgi:protein TonB
MTVPFPLDAFDEACPVRPKRKPLNVDTDKLVGIGITIAVHAVILAMALTAVHVSRTKVLQELSVQITPEKREVMEDVKPLPKMATPTIITVPPPEFTVRTVTPPPVAAQPPVANPAPPAPVAVASTAPGETKDSYLGRLLAQLNRFKQYPRAARQARIEGVVMLHFVMDADGKILSFEIAKSSGRPVLDGEALALIQRAQPLPALPPDFPTRTLDAVVPIEFSLKG